MSSAAKNNVPTLQLVSDSENEAHEERTHDFKKEFEQRILRLEDEVKKSIDRLERQFDHTLKKMPTSLRQQKALKSSLHRGMLELENKIHSLSHLSLSEDKKLPAPKASPLRKANFYFNRITSLRTYKRMLVGKPGLEREEFDDFGRDPDFEKRVKPFFDFLYYQYWRVSPVGLENIPDQGRALIVANHSGTLPFDGSMIRLAVTNDHPARRDVRFLVEDFVYYLPFMGSFMYKIGGVRASPENAERLLNKNHLVTVFPEGEKGIGKNYKLRYHLQRFGRGGFIKLAIKTGAPIVPCAVIGAEETQPLLYRANFLAKPFGIPYVPVTPTIPWLGPVGLIGLPAKWSIYFGKPIYLNQYGKEALSDELLIHRLSEMVRMKIQEMIREGLKKRRSVWWG